MVDGLEFVFGELCLRAAQVCKRSEGWDTNKGAAMKEGSVEEVVWSER